MSPGRRVAAPALAGLIALALAGCGSERVTVPVASDAGPPAPSSAVGAVERLEWAYANRSFDAYHDLFTSDFVFRFAPLDPAGAPYAGAWARQDELDFAVHLMVSGTDSAEAASALRIGDHLPPVDLPDTTGGRDPRWHRIVSDDLQMIVTLHDGGYAVAGREVFHLVRGDSAAVPRDPGATADSMRWYIVGWDDTIDYASAWRGARPAATQPGAALTWGWLKSRYRVLHPRARPS